MTALLFPLYLQLILDVDLKLEWEQRQVEVKGAEQVGVGVPVERVRVVAGGVATMELTGGRTLFWCNTRDSRTC